MLILMSVLPAGGGDRKPYVAMSPEGNPWQWRERHD